MTERSLLIVESPTKAKTIERFLSSSKGTRVVASMGHVRDLPKGELGVNEETLEPRYVIPTRVRKNVTSLKKEAQKASRVVLATDEDREGESISWHLKELLGLGEEKPYQRIVFHEITKEAIERALEKPRDIDPHLVEAQQARRVLDRLVGYKLSPLLWKKLMRGLSAGRVQSVAVRLIVEREREIKKFVPQEYWTVEAELKKGKFPPFPAVLAKKDGKTIPKTGIQSKEEAETIVEELKKVSWSVSSVQRKEVKKNPPPPFMTSTLQQASWKKFRYPAKFTMASAQFLYEKGYITYHRTDSLNLSSSALSAAREFIASSFGKGYLPESPRFFKKKGRTQEAHEAIRPTDASRTPESLKKSLSSGQFRLYQLIWQRFLACQMAPAVFDSVGVDITAGPYTLRAGGQAMRFEGFLKAYPVQIEESQLPPLEKGDTLSCSSITPLQHFTQPPPRYTEATLVKTLEEEGIGRPSTYAPTISTILARNYVEKDEQKRFIPTEMGYMVNDLLVEHFPDIVDLKFTAQMEEDLDRIAENEEDWKKVVREFWDPFKTTLEQKYEEIEKKNLVEETDRTCKKCGAPAVLRFGRFGKFYGCSTFPECKWTEGREPTSLGIPCPSCKEGNVVVRTTKRKRTFYGCSRYPECTFSVWDKPTGDMCPSCGTPLVEDKKKRIKCSNKECERAKV